MVRIKERYMLVNILYPTDLGKKDVPDVVVIHQPTIEELSPPALIRAIKAEVTALFGDYGAGAVEKNVQVKYLSLATSTFIIRTLRSHYRLVWSALTCMNRVPAKQGRPCVFRVVRVSGTMRKVEQEAIRQARLLMLAAKEGASLQADGGKHVDALSSMFGTTTTKASQDMARLDTMDSSSDEENDEGQDDSGDAEELEEAG